MVKCLLHCAYYTANLLSQLGTLTPWKRETSPLHLFQVALTLGYLNRISTAWSTMSCKSLKDQKTHTRSFCN